MLLHSKTRLPCGPPLVVLDRHKYIIREAARLTLSSACSSGFGVSLEQKIYWSMILLRHRFDSSNCQYQKSLKAYPHLDSFVSNTQGVALLDIRALRLHIDELQYSKATGDLADLPSGPDVCESIAVKRNKLAQYLTLWASRRRKIINLVIVDGDGEAPRTVDGTACLLSDHWTPHLGFTNVSIALARVALRGHIPTCDPSINCVLSFDDFCERINRLRDSGVGTDSLLYSCWIFCHHEGRLALYNVYLHLLEEPLGENESEFLDSRLVFIQKGKIEIHQAGDCRRHPSKTRPLNLANTDCKIVSCMISIVLTCVCNTCIRAYQSGGIRGKQMIDLIFSLEFKIIEYISHAIPHSGIFCLGYSICVP